MPSIEMNKKDLEFLCGQKFGTKDELEDALWLTKTELESLEGDKIKASQADTNRPDLLSTEGVARELRYRLGKQKTIIEYKTKKSGITASVDSQLQKIRPAAAYAVAWNVKITDDFLRQLIQLQEKICLTYGRKRKEAAIGIFDLDQVHGNVRYYAADPKTEFIPLEYKTKMSLSEILTEHPKGKEYAELLKGQAKYPLLVDSNNEVLSFPPIINSQGSGQVTEKTKNMFLDVTGFDQAKINTALNIVCAALADRGALIGSVEINYGKEKTTTPHFAKRKINFQKSTLEKYFGETKKDGEWKTLFQKSGFGAKIKSGKIECEYANLRQDILHAVDIIEDLLISADYNRFLTEEIRLAAVGNENFESLLVDRVRDACIGIGLQEILTYTLTSREKQETKIGNSKEEFVELSNPVSQNYAIFRKSLFPEILEFLGKNKSALYPQHVFEVGKALVLDPKSETGVSETQHVCIGLCGSNTNFSLAKSHLQALCQSLNLTFEIGETNHPAFEKGQAGTINANEKKGIIGMLNSKTLNNFGLEKPTAIIELEL
ncbi:MAG: phenylalanine--tRNA ligase subunit beta [Candidatus Micrarchaeota archaeon]